MNKIIIVLGGGINPDGSIPEIPKRRVDEGVRLYRAERHANMVMSGKYSFWLDWQKQVPAHTEAEGMAHYAGTQGVPSEDIFTETDSKDTIGNAYFTKINLLEPQGWNEVTVVTSDYHVARTKYIFDLVLGPAYKLTYVGADTGLAHDAQEKLYDQEVINQHAVAEILGTQVTAGDNEAMKHILCTKHPAYATNSEFSYEKLHAMMNPPQGTK